MHPIGLQIIMANMQSGRGAPRALANGETTVVVALALVVELRGCASRWHRQSVEAAKWKVSRPTSRGYLAPGKKLKVI